MGRPLLRTKLFADVRQKTHVAGSLDRDRNRPLVDGRIAGPSASLNLAVSAHHLAEKFDVLVVDEGRPWGFAVHVEPAALVRLLDLRHLSVVPFDGPETVRFAGALFPLEPPMVVGFQADSTRR